MPSRADWIFPFITFGLVQLLYLDKMRRRRASYSCQVFVVLDSQLNFQANILCVTFQPVLQFGGHPNLVFVEFLLGNSRARQETSLSYVAEIVCLPHVILNMRNSHVI
jgi:hypothetical protein